MPELIEVEAYRRAAVAALDRPIVAVDAPDAWFCKPAADGAPLPPEAFGLALVGERFRSAERLGKLLWLPTGGAELGLRFGMTGRLVVDGVAPIGELEYGPRRHDPAWERFRVRFADGGELVVVDARRLGGVLLDPDRSRLGPDAATLGAAALRTALAGAATPVKAALLDQQRVAGLGNLLVDESLWRAGVSPFRPAGALDAGDPAGVASRHLARTVRATVADLTRRGGSHTGDLQPHRRPGGACPRCGGPLRRDRVGGRTTWWCAACQS